MNFRRLTCRAEIVKTDILAVMELATGTLTGKRSTSRANEKGLSRNRPTTSTWRSQAKEKRKDYIKRSMSEWSGASEYPLGTPEDIIQRLLSLGR